MRNILKRKIAVDINYPTTKAVRTNLPTSYSAFANFLRWLLSNFIPITDNIPYGFRFVNKNSQNLYFRLVAAFVVLAFVATQCGLGMTAQDACLRRPSRAVCFRQKTLADPPYLWRTQGRSADSSGPRLRREASRPHSAKIFVQPRLFVGADQATKIFVRPASTTIAKGNGGEISPASPNLFYKFGGRGGHNPPSWPPILEQTCLQIGKMGAGSTLGTGLRYNMVT